MYRLLFRLVFARVDPELTHHLGAGLLKTLSQIGLLRAKPKPRKIEIAGLKFENRIGLAAGFDKNAQLIRPMHALGFGHVEIGTVTAQPQPGNPKPRLFRVTSDRALINRMGFNNQGAQVVAERLSRLRASGGNLPVIGVNIGKSRAAAVEDAVEDYQFSAKLLAPMADYLAVNVSSPNTPGLRDLQQVEQLRPILQAVLQVAGGVPVLVKIAPDLSDEDVDAIADLSLELGLAGVIAVNTTISRTGLKPQPVLAEAGGLSGPILAERSKQILGRLRSRLGPQSLIISVGGIETLADAEERLSLGADLVQGYTGFVYGGPSWPASLARAKASGQPD